MTAADLFRLIATLFAALFAPARMLARMLARVVGFDRARLKGLAHFLETLKARGHALAYEGEDDATIARRIDRAAWIAADPVAALKHLVRTHRGLFRERFAMVAPPSDAPPVLVCMPLRDGDVAPVGADTS